MAIAKKSVTTGTSNGATATVSVVTSETPSATAVGDLVVVIYGNNFYTLSNMGTPSATGTPTMNAIGSAVADAGSNNAHIKGYWYVANTAGAQTITATETGDGDEEKYITAYVLGGADTTTPIDAAASNFSSTSATPNTAPAVSPTSSDAFVIAATSTGGGASTPSYTTPSPLTEDGEIHVGGLSGVSGSAQLAASGSTGTFDFTPEDSKAYAAVTIAVATASTSSVAATADFGGTFAAAGEITGPPVKYISQGAAVAGTTSITTAAYGTGWAEGDLGVCVVASNHATTEATEPTVAGFTNVGTLNGGGGSQGVGTGNRRLTFFTRELQSGDDTTPTISLSTGNVMVAAITILRKPSGYAWATAVSAFGAETTAGTGWSQAMTSDPGFAAADMLVAACAVRDTSDSSAEGFTATGATFEALTERVDTSSETGNDIALHVATATVTAGPSSAAGTRTATHSTSETGVMGVLRVRAALTTVTGAAAASFGGTLTASGVPRTFGAAAAPLGFTATAAGVPETFGAAAASYGFTATASGTAAAPPIEGQASASLGGTFAAAGVDRAVGQAVAAFGGTLAALGVDRAVGQAVASLGGTFTSAGIDRALGVAAASLGGTFAASGSASEWGPQLGAGVRAGEGTAGFRGDVGDLTVMNPGGSLTGTVFAGTGTSWDGNALLVQGTDLVVEGYQINGSVTHIGGANLTIRHCIIDTPQGELWCVAAEGPTQGTLTIEDTTISGTPGPGTAVIGSGVGADCKLIVRRCDISGVGDHIHISGYQGTGFADSALVSQCYLHDGTFLDDDQHADYIQCSNNNSNYTSDSGQTYLTIEHTATDISVGPLDVAYSSGATAGHTTGGPSEFVGPHLSLKFDNNHFPAGAYHLRLQARLNDCVVTNNNFGFRNVANDEFGLAAVDAFPASTITWTNNIDGNGDPYTYGDPGPDAPTTQATGSFGGTFTAAGIPRTAGAAVAAFGYAATAQGVDRAVGVAVTAFGFTASSSGVDRALGQAAAAFGFTGAANGSGAAEVTGTAAAAFGFTATAAGVDQALGVAAASFGFTGSALGVDRAVGAAVAAFGYTATTAGGRRVLGVAVVAFGFDGTAVGVNLSIVTPAERTVVVPAEDRTVVVPAENRTVVVPARTQEA